MSATAAPAQTKRLTRFASNPVAALGQGFDTFMGNAKDIAVTVTEPVPESSSSTVEYSMCSGVDELTAFLGIDLAAAGVYEGASSSAKVQMAANLRFTEYSVAVAIHATQARGTTLALGYNLNVPQPTPETMNTFVQRYGDSFVTSITKGGYYAAVFMFYAESEDEQLQVTTALNGEGIVAGGTVSGSFSSNLQIAQTKSKVRQSSHQAMGGTSGVALPGTVSDMIAFALNFSALPLSVSALAIIGFRTQGYEGLIAQFDKVANNRKLFLGTEIPRGSPRIPGLSDRIAALSILEDTIQDVQETYAVYRYNTDGSADPDLATNLKTIQQDLDTAVNLLNRIDADPTQTYQMPATFPGLAVGVANLNFNLVTSDQYGGTGQYGTGEYKGNAFNDVDASSVPNRQRINSIGIKGDTWVNLLTVGYTDSSGVSVQSHGTDSGTDRGKVSLQADEVITSIGVRWGWLVNQITINTSRQQSFTAPPNPEKTGLSATYTPPSGSVMMGFNGLQGDHLAQVQFVSVQFRPATWTKLSKI